VKNSFFKSALGLTLAIALASCNTNPAPAALVVPASSAAHPVKLGQSVGTALPASSYFVELQGGPTFDGLSSQSVLSAQSSFRSQAKSAGIQYQEKYSYSSLFNGFSVQASSSEALALSRLPGVKAVYAVGRVRPAEARPDSRVSDPELATAIVQTGVSVVQNELGFTGKGIKVGIIDSGIDMQHPAFKNPDGSSRVVAQYDFVGDSYNADPGASTYDPIARPDNNADDCGGHGTHVAGIVGGRDSVITGVAPEVSFGAYKIFGCEGSVDEDVIVAALERAASDGMQVVNMSLGNFGALDSSPDAQAVQRLIARGVVVVDSAGNSGTDGAFGLGSLASAQGAITVASFENTALKLSIIKAGGLDVGFNAAENGGKIPVSGTLPIKRTGSITSTDDGCAALPANSLKSSAALIRRGTCTFYQKALNAQNAGASAVILYNREAGRISPSVSGDTPITIPVLFITKADGEALNAQLDAGQIPTLIWTDQLKIFANPLANLLDTFSSYGPTAALGFKPDLGAPGGNIYSSYPLELGGYTSLSGTSMASPHVAGIAALMLQANPTLKPADIKARLQNTAKPQLYAPNPKSGYLDTVQRQGAGMADAVGSIQSKVVITPSNLALGASTSVLTSRTLTLTNSGAEAVTYTLGSVDAINIFGTFKPIPYPAKTNVTFSSSGVTVPAGGSASVNVTIDAPDSEYDDETVYGGYLTFSSSKQTLRVPFLGFKGDYQAVQALLRPTLAYLDSDSGKVYPQDENTLFTLERDDKPSLAYKLAYPAQRVEIEVLDGNTYLPLFRLGSLADVTPDVGRDQSSTAVNVFTWDGSIKAAQIEQGLPVTKTVGNGRYVLRIRVLKVLGDPNIPAQFETYASAPFFILKSHD